MYTNTITLSLPKLTTEVTLTLKTTFLQRVQGLIQEMITKNAFSTETREIILQWENRLVHCFQDQMNDNQERAALELCSFLIEFIRPAYIDELNENKQIIIFEYELTLKAILSELIQKDELSTEDYIENIQLAYDKKEFGHQVLKTTQIAQAIIPVAPGIFLDRIKSFISNMLASNSFSVAEKQLIEQWMRESMNYFQESTLQTQEDKEIAVQVLCFLLIDTIRPAYLNELDTNKQREIFEFEVTLKIILRDLLEADESYVDNYIASIQSLCFEQDLVEKALKHIEKQTESYLQDILQHATGINANLINQFNDLKKRLLVVHTNAQTDSQQVAQRLINLMEKVQVLFDSIKVQTNTMQELSNRIIADHRTFESLCRNISNLMEKL